MPPAPLPATEQPAPVADSYSATKSAAWAEHWIGNLLKNKKIPGLEHLFAKEDPLLERYYGAYGRGFNRHDPRTFSSRSGGTGVVIGTALRTAIPGSNILRHFEGLYKKVAEPLFQKYFPELLTDPKYKALKEKILRETMRNALLVEWTAELHRSQVPEMANLWFGLSHPVYDGMMDTEIDEGPDAPKYSIKEKLVRATRIIMRDYDIPKPLLKMEYILIEIVKGLDQTIPEQNREIFFDELWKLNAAQLESIRQKFPSMTLEDLRLTTFRKGGYSTRLYALLADHVFTSHELDTYFLEGAFLQNLDDMSDVEEDAAEGGMTLVVKRQIIPEDLWAMTKIWFRRMDDYAVQGIYDPNKTLNYFRSVETFLIVATGKYTESMQRADRILKGEKLNPDEAPFPFKQLGDLMGYAAWPFMRVIEWAIPMAKFAD